MQGVPEQVRALTPDDPWKSPLLAPFRQIGSQTGSQIDDEEAPRIKSAALHAYETQAAPAFRKLFDYLTTTYIPAARESLGLGALPHGAAWYAYIKFGQLFSEFWRAMRVAVDTGIHAKGWSREQAVEFFRENTGQDDRAIEIEIERYLNDPGLGAAYTMGELKFRELRAEAQNLLGPAFDLPAFHDEVLRHGALPLDVLERNVRAWVKGRMGAPTRKAALRDVNESS